jgi:hypothetical protein
MVVFCRWTRRFLSRRKYGIWKICFSGTRKISYLITLLNNPKRRLSPLDLGSVIPLAVTDLRLWDGPTKNYWTAAWTTHGRHDVTWPSDSEPGHASDAANLATLPASRNLATHINILYIKRHRPSKRDPSDLVAIYLLRSQSRVLQVT